MQVLFIDKTTLNVGPNSSLVIDRFVYNPATTNGQLALSLSKGVLRVVGGVATHSEGATIRTPVAAIGLRGGIAIISHNASEGHPGDPRLRPHVGHDALRGSATNCHRPRLQVTRPGFGVTVAGFNQAALFPRPGKQPGARASEWPVDEPRRANRRSEPAADGQSGAELQRRHAQLAWRADRRHQRRQRGGAPTPLQAVTQRRDDRPEPARRPQPRSEPRRPSSRCRALIDAADDADQAAADQPPVTADRSAADRSAGRPAGRPVDLRDGHPRAFSTSDQAPSPVPYLTGAFAGTGGFTVSPILGYQTRRPQSGRHAEHDLETVPSRPQRDGAGRRPERDAVRHDVCRFRTRRILASPTPAGSRQ